MTYRRDKRKGSGNKTPFAREGKPNSNQPSESESPLKKDLKDKSSYDAFKDRNFGSHFKKLQKRNIDQNKKQVQNQPAEKEDKLIRLNKFLAHAGICSRREADELIRQGLVEVNGTIVTELGTRIDPEKDIVRYGGSIVRGERKVYILLNKPKGYITTTKDEKARKNVMELVAGACRERIYPVGRLDRQTTGLLLLTNDGELAKKLTHPSHGAPKLYYAILDKNVAPGDMEKIRRGIILEDGPAPVDEIEYVEGKDRNHVGIRLHIGRNRIVRRIFQHLGYEVIALDRTMFAGLTKKNLPRGHYRFLTEKEIGMLKML
ncbi:pseudouridine synthase [Schleiferia thermophila]|jgi:23S rRNA pseudouridine2605 synthase|uniref:Pseudouridine synthase n=1 Tax=Schleiferia thermophila TaxID=884107 RepID=A0A369A7E7_9FLAO|nr:pseudouridine synthase [Schleiferia thermophila]RCX03354.1 23S rRNA pseudouridine2605 synthase [Schleiferia thermophila]GCD80483.1 hypothetical protein JCM30197_17300 [Schleiferia thermophila]